MIPLRFYALLILSTTMPKLASGVALEKPVPTQMIEKRGLMEEFCCCFAEGFSGKLGQCEVYGTDNFDCTVSTNSIFEDFDFRAMEPGNLPYDERYKATLEKLKLIMGALRQVELQLEDADDFHDLSLLDQVKRVCNSRNVRNICKINISKIDPLEWVYFFDRAKKEDLAQLDAFQTNINDRFKNVKDLIDHYCEEYRIKGLTFN